MDGEDYPLAVFSSKKRYFRFETGVDRVDLGCCSGYWTMAGGRRCISEHSVDRAGQIFETYFFSNEGITDQGPKALFEAVKSAHRAYEHDPDIAVSARTVADDEGRSFWALDVLIADHDRVYRVRQPFWQAYFRKDIPISMWSLYQTYGKAQRSQIPFLLLRAETGDSSWGDREIYKSVPIGSQAELEASLGSLPNKAPLDTYAVFNHSVVDARDLARPFNESVFTLAVDWQG